MSQSGNGTPDFSASALLLDLPAWVTGTTASEQPDALAIAIARQRTFVMLTAARLLTPRQRVVIKMRYVDERTWSEIGIALNISSEAAIGLHTRAAASMRRALGITD